MAKEQTPDFEDLGDDLHAEVAVVAGRLNRDHADLVALTVRLVEGGLWAGGGVRSPEHWLVLRAGLSTAHARDVVRLARRRLEVAPAIALLQQGQLSLDQATEVARRVPASRADEVTAFARHATVPQLRRLLARYPFDPQTGPHDAAPDESASPEPGGEEGSDGSPTHSPLAGQGCDQTRSTASAFAGPPELVVRDRAPASLSMTHEAGRFRLVYDAPADVGALVEAAVREAKDALFRTGQTDATMGDAIAEMANRSLSAVESRSRLDKYRVLIHLDTDGAWVNGRQALPRHLLEKITCDGVLQPVWETDGKPVSVGRSMRIVPRRTRRLVEDRDRGCRFPGCTAVGFVENHHVDHWCDGGPTDYDRLVSLCPFHHDSVHSAVISASGDPTSPDGLEFRDCAGNLITGPEYSPPPPPLPRPHDAARVMVAEAGSAVAALWDGQSSPWPDEADAPYRGPTGQQLHPGWIEFAAS